MPMPTIEHMLEQLAPLGIVLATGITVQSVLDDFSHPRLRSGRGRNFRAKIENGGYKELFSFIGQERYDFDAHRRMGPYCEALWFFDAECIEDPDEYVSIARRAALLSGSDLVFDDVRGNVDHDANEAWLELTWRGEKERVELQVNHDWADVHVFKHLEQYLLATGTERRFAIHDYGQGGFIVCQTPSVVSALNKITGLQFTVGLGPKLGY
jgi:hypothetical protein